MQKTVKRAQKGFTLIELLIVIAVIAILAAIAIPNLLSSRKAANESSAISSLRTLVSAEETYRSRQTPPKYGDLAALSGTSLIDSVLAGGKKSGFNFAVGDVAPGDNVYSFKAEPQSNAGDRSFYVDQTGVIKVLDGSTAPTATTGSPIQ